MKFCIYEGLLGVVADIMIASDRPHMYASKSAVTSHI